MIVAHTRTEPRKKADIAADVKVPAQDSDDALVDILEEALPASDAEIQRSLEDGQTEGQGE